MNAYDLRLLDMPRDGLYRVARRGELVRFPPPLAHPHVSFENPVFEGYRWEDARETFATLKFSRSSVAAIGRAIAMYRERRLPSGVTLVEHIDRYFGGRKADDSVSMPVRCVPASFFEEMLVQRLCERPGVQFVDLVHQRTRDTLMAVAGEPLERLGVHALDANIYANRDRRVTTTIVRALFDLCRSEGVDQVAGLRYPGAPGKEWDAFVVWESAARSLLPLDAGAEVRPVAATDRDVLSACAALGIEPPVVS